jgi:cell wall-associated NlpC family hydrolase
VKKLFLITVVAVAVLMPSPARADNSIVERALGFLGIKYKFASENENRGFDCAGLVKRTFALAGIRMPRTAAAQFREGCSVKREELLPGDLVFFKQTYKNGISHVGIYIGDGRFVHAASTPRRVQIDRLDAPYYASRFAGARRIAI